MSRAFIGTLAICLLGSAGCVVGLAAGSVVAPFMPAASREVVAHSDLRVGDSVRIAYDSARSWDHRRGVVTRTGTDGLLVLHKGDSTGPRAIAGNARLDVLRGYARSRSRAFWSPFLWSTAGSIVGGAVDAHTEYQDAIITPGFLIGAFVGAGVGLWRGTRRAPVWRPVAPATSPAAARLSPPNVPPGVLTRRAFARAPVPPA